MRVAVVAVGLAGCIKPYQPGSFASHEGAFTGKRVALGCLELAVSRQVDHEGAAVVGYELGNRCDRPALVDLAHVTVHSRGTDGIETTLVPYDPRGELVPLRLPARHAGREAIAYTPGDAMEICVDAAAIAGASPAHWVCLSRAEVEL